MSRNGAGTYSLPAGNPVVTGTTISSSWANTTLSDIGTALTASIANDGQTPILANLPMSGYKHTGVAVAASLTDYARADQDQNSSLKWLTSVAGTDTITASAIPTPAAYAAGQTFRFVSAGANAGTSVTLNVSSLGAKSITKNGATALAAGDIPSGAVVVVTYDGTQFQLTNVKQSTASGSITASGYTQNTARLLGRTTASAGAIEEISVGTGLTLSSGTLSAAGTVLRSYLAGLGMSTAGSSTTMTIAAGQATDSTNTALLSLASSMAKTTSAWAAGTGNGGLDTGAIANSTWYHFYLITKADGSAGDVVFSTSASAPSLPATYTLYRRIGSGLTNGSGQWVLFKQNGDEFLWSASVKDFDTVNPGTSAVLQTMTVPTGVQVKWIGELGVFVQSTNYISMYASSPDQADEAPGLSSTAALSAPGFNATSVTNAAWYMNRPYPIRTNTSAQIRYRMSASGANDRAGGVTLGWIDTRGRDN